MQHGCGCTGWSCTGCFGGGCCGGIVTWATPARVAPPMAAPEPAAPKADDKKPASIEIELPAEAKLIVDGQVVPGTGASRAFTTPALLADRTYYYEMSAELPIDGAMVRQELRVVVRGGEIVKESFGELLAKVKAANTATVANK
ncbi:MAG: TIGR03000 domain-containing protein [Planctomycetia bacterium]|nr:TIGR03000 domain-containing protein [Planctomycetia bacterium]